MSDVRELEKWFSRKFDGRQCEEAQQAEGVLLRLRRQVAHDLDVPDDENGLYRIPEGIVLSDRAESLYAELNHMLGE